jgi:hypothetical protein
MSRSSPSSRFDILLSAIERPACATYQKPMRLAGIAPGPSGYDCRTFECAKCDHLHIRVVASDPMKSDSQGWLAGELRAPI